jgi:hypothetical protein
VEKTGAYAKPEPLELRCVGFRSIPPGWLRRSSVAAARRSHIGLSSAAALRVWLRRAARSIAQVSEPNPYAPSGVGKRAAKEGTYDDHLSRFPARCERRVRTDENHLKLTACQSLLQPHD